MLWNPLEIGRRSNSCRQKTISETRKCLFLWCVYRCPHCAKEARCVVLLGRGVCWCRLCGTADNCQNTRNSETGSYENIFLLSVMSLGPLRLSSNTFLSIHFLWLVTILFYFCSCFPVLWFILVVCTVTLHCATSRKVVGSMPGGVFGIFHWHNPSGRTMALRSTQPLAEMSTRNFLGGYGGRCVGLTSLPPSCVDCLEIWELQPPGTLWACLGL